MIIGKSAAIHVCALRHVSEMTERTGALHLVSAINAELQPETPASIAPHRHLKLDMHDITEAYPDVTAPSTDHVANLLDFVHGWDRQTPLLIHCFAGISRSTAAAFITLCALNPDTREDVVARALRRSSDTALPNRLFVALADDALRREGRMVEALGSMGRYKAAVECVPFEICALHEPRSGSSGPQAA